MPLDDRKTPRKIDPCNATLGGGSGAASRNSSEVGGALGRVGARGGGHAHPQPVCARRWGGEATDGGTQRCQAAAAAVASAPARGAHGTGQPMALGAPGSPKDGARVVGWLWKRREARARWWRHP
jgi:hypothetical protein